MDPRPEPLSLSYSLGSGCCGEVFAVEGNDSLVAKRYAAMAIDRAILQRTFHCLAKMPPHPGIEQILDSRLDTAPYFSLSQKVPGVPLGEAPPFKEAEAWELIRFLAGALGHAHKHGVYHGHLHPGSILYHPVGSQREPATILDFGTGFVGEIHLMDLDESFLFAAPEQLACGGRDWAHGNIQRWDVYSFGALAYLLIHGDIPRGGHYRKQHQAEVAHAGGRHVPIDLDKFLAEVRSHDSVSWGMGLRVNREHRLYREIIERCLSLDPSERPVDLREVSDAFQALDSRFELERAAERVQHDRRKQKAKLVGARWLAAVLGVSFALASWLLADYLDKTSFFRSRVDELGQVVRSQKETILDLDERWAETVTDLKSSREAADAFFHRMARGDASGGTGVSALKPENLEKSRNYYLETLADVGDGSEKAPERARALHSLAHIEHKLGMTARSITHFEDAAAEFETILALGKLDRESTIDTHLRLADCWENLGTLAANPLAEEAINALHEAVSHFEAARELDPENEETVSREAGTAFLLGRAHDAHEDHEAAIAAYSRSAELATWLSLQEEKPSDPLIELIGKLQFHAASSLARGERFREAIDAHIASMETLEKLRSVNGFTPLQSIQLASSYLELGILLEKEGATPEEQDQLFNEALRLLTPLNGTNSGDVEVASLLCRSLVRLAHLEREADRWTEGYQLSVRGIEALKEALESSENPEPSGLLALAESRLEHLRFLEEDEDDARQGLVRGITTAETLRAQLASGAVAEPALSSHLRRLRSLLGEYAETAESLGEAELAQSCREMASLPLAAVLAPPEEPQE